MYLLKDFGKHSASVQIVLLALALFMSGCTTIGPDSIPRDRFDYNTAISDSWKEQTLLNIVKIRYSDMPLFVEVASVVSGYTMQSSVNIAGTATNLPGGGGDLASLGNSPKQPADHFVKIGPQPKHCCSVFPCSRAGFQRPAKFAKHSWG